MKTLLSKTLSISSRQLKSYSNNLILPLSTTATKSSCIKNNNNNNNIKCISNNSISSISSINNNTSSSSLYSCKYYSTHLPPNVGEPSSSSTSTLKKTTILDIKKKFNNNIPISMVTAYDYCSSKEVDTSGVDMILVGDSLGMVMLGEKGTTNVTMDQMLHHCKAVMKGSKRAFVVGDLPFGSFEASSHDAVRNSIRLVKEGGVDAIKLEGGRKHRDTIAAIVNAGVPVMGHIGLTPQSVSALGGFRLQGKTANEAMSIVEDALALQEAGCFAIVIEMVPDVVAAEITKRLSIPTIGIGAGVGTSGQVLVYHDMLGMYSDFMPKFCKQYASLSPIIQNGLRTFKSEMENRQFPSPSHSFNMKQEESNLFISKLSNNQSNNSNNSMDSLYNTYVNNNNVGEKVKELMDKEKEIVKQQQRILKINNNNNNQPTTNIISSFNNNNNNLSPSSINLLPEKKNKKKVAVIGAGAMGSFFSAKLASNPNTDVWMVSAWREHVEKINGEGLTLYNLKGEQEKVKSIRATLDSLDVIKEGYPDLVLVLVKSPATKQASLTASKMVAGNPDAIVLTLQNGVGNREEIEKIIADKGYSNRVWQGVTSNGCCVIEPGIVRHTGQGPTYLASPLLTHKRDYGMEGKQESVEEKAALEALSGILCEAGIESEVSYDVDGLVWGKVVANAAINPLSAVLGVPNGYLVKNEYPKTLMRKLVGEGMEVCKAKGIRLPYGDDTDAGFQYVADIAERTSSNYSSMLVDVIRGQPTEINSINGVIVTEGERLDVSVSYNKMIMEMVLNHCHNKKTSSSLL